jgi:hypothetical protein
MIWLRRLSAGVLDSWVGAAWLLKIPRRGEPESLRTGSRAPVLILPGVYETWRYMLPLARHLHATGHPVHVLTTLGLNSGRIPDAAALAARYLEHNDLKGVVIVAHSKGGLIGKHLMAIDDTAGRVARMVAIATPFSGSWLARYAPVRTLRVFRPEGRLLSTLAKNYAINSRITSIAGEFDEVIPGGSVLDGATNITVPVIGHFRLLSAPALLETVVMVIDPE